MPIKDRVVNWFIKNVLLPSNELLNQPGFIVTRFSDKHGQIFFRELFLPETVFSEIEKEIIAKYKEKGKAKLYSLGKKYGYHYASVSKFPSITKVSKQKFLDFGYFFAHYVESTWASKLTYKLDYEKKKMTFEIWDYPICSKNGEGHLFTEGATAGLWAYFVDDITTESIQVKCQGNGNEYCIVIAAPEKILKETRPNFFTEKNIKKTIFNEKYLKLNAIKKFDEEFISLKTLIDTKKVKYQKGKMIFLNERFFIIESSITDMIEKINDLDIKDIIYEKSFEFGKQLKIPENKFSFVRDFLQASGWGKITLLKKQEGEELVCEHFPWTVYSKGNYFELFAGLISGMASNIEKRKIRFRLIKTEESMDSGFVVTFKESQK